MSPNRSRKIVREHRNNFRVYVRISGETEEEVQHAADSMGVMLRHVYPNQQHPGFLGYGTRICLRPLKKGRQDEQEEQEG